MRTMEVKKAPAQCYRLTWRSFAELSAFPTTHPNDPVSPEDDILNPDQRISQWVYRGRMYNDAKDVKSSIKPARTCWKQPYWLLPNRHMQIARGPTSSSHPSLHPQKTLHVLNILPLCRHHACTLLIDRPKPAIRGCFRRGKRVDRVVAEGSICRSLLCTQRNRVRHALNETKKPYCLPTAGWIRERVRKKLDEYLYRLSHELCLNFCFPDLFLFPL